MCKQPRITLDNTGRLHFCLHAMASIFKKPRSPFWFAAYRDANGERRQKTTKTANRGEAIDMARSLERLAALGRKGALTEAAARQAISQLVEQATGESMAFHTCRAWLTEWLASKKGTINEETLDRYEQVFTGLADFLDKRADLSLAAITPADVRKYRDKLSSEGRAPSTVNLQLKRLNAPFAEAKTLGYIMVNPVAAVERLNAATEDKREPFTSDQLRALLKVAEGDWLGAVLAGYYTGLRLSDIANLRWQDVNMDASLVEVTPSKTANSTGKTIVAPLHGEFSAWLRKQPHGIGKAPVFPTLAGKPTGGGAGLSTQFANLLQRAGIVGKVIRTAEGKGRSQSSLVFHSLRHSFVSALATADVSPELRMKLSGHANERTHAIYTHTEIETLRAAVAKLPSLAS